MPGPTRSMRGSHPHEPPRLFVEHGLYADNLGDAAMLAVVYARVRRSIPAAEVWVRNCRGDLDRFCPGCRRLDVPYEYIVYDPWLWIGSRLGLSPRSHGLLYSVVVLIRTVMALIIACTGRLAGRFPTRHARLRTYLQTLRRCDGVIVAGNGTIKDVNPEWTHTLCAQFLIARVLGCRLSISGMGIGPVRSALTRLLMRLAFPLCRYVGLRDAGASEQFLRRLGVPARRLHTVGDDALGVDALSPTWACERMRSLGVWDIRARYVAIHYRLGSLNQGYEAHVDAMTRLAEQLVRRDDIRLLFFVMDEGSQERELSQRILAGPLVRGRACVLPRFADPAEIKALLGVCSAAVGASYHFTLLSLSAGVPALALYRNPYYCGKMAGALYHFGHPEWGHDLRDTDADTLERRVSELLALSEGVRPALMARAAELRTRAHRSIDTAILAALGRAHAASSQGGSGA